MHTLRYVTLRYIRLRYVAVGYVALRYVILCYILAYIHIHILYTIVFDLLYCLVILRALTTNE